MLGDRSRPVLITVAGPCRQPPRRAHLSRDLRAAALVVPTPGLSSVAWVPPAPRAVGAGICDLPNRQVVAAEGAGAVVAPVAHALAPPPLRLVAERTDAAA